MAPKKSKSRDKSTIKVHNPKQGHQKENTVSARSSMEIILVQKWNDLEKNICQIFTKKDRDKKLYMESFSMAHNFCLAAHSLSSVEMPVNAYDLGLYQYRKIERFLKSHVAKIGSQLADLMEDNILRVYFENWENYKKSSLKINGIFGTLNRQWLPMALSLKTQNIVKIDVLALKIWNEDQCIHTKIITTIMELIEDSRNGKIVNTALISHVIKSYTQLENDLIASGQKVSGIFQLSFERTLLCRAEVYYKEKRTEFLERNSIGKYLAGVEELIQEENQNLHKESLDLLLRTMNTIFLEQTHDMLLNGFKILLADDKNSDLQRMYQLVSKMPDILHDLVSIFLQHVTDEGISAIEKCVDAASKDPYLYVTTLMDVYNKYNALVQDVFCADKTFCTAFDKACKKFFNNNAITTNAEDSNNKSSELLIKYCDSLLRKNSKNLNESELENALNLVVAVFSKLDDKDVFATLYSKTLAVRLINEKSVSDNAEMYMISKMKECSNFGYSRNLEKMFLDINLSKDLTERFREHLSRPDEKMGAEFTIKVLSTGSWRLQEKFTFILPSEVETYMNRFTEFYGIQHSGRKLNWLSSMSKGELVTNCFKKQYTLQVCSLKMAVLLQFNNSTSFTVKKLCENIQIEESILLLVIKILLASKLLASTDKETEIHTNSQINLFTGFSNKKLKINLNVPITKKQKVANSYIIEEDRKL